MVPNLLAHLPVGVIIDRRDPWLVMRLSQMCRLAAILLLLIGLLWPPGTTIILPIAIALESVFATTFRMAGTVTLPRLATNGLVARAIGKNEARNHTALLMGRPLGGMADSINHKMPYVLDIVACVVTIVMLGPLRKLGPAKGRRVPESPPRSPMTGQIKHSIAWLHEDGFLRQTLLLFSVTNFLFQTTIILLITMMKRDGLSSVSIGVLLATTGLGGIAGSRFAVAMLRTIKLERAPYAAVLAWLGLTTVIALSDNPFILATVWTGVGFVGSIMNVGRDVYQATNVPEYQRGRVVSLNALAAQAPSALGALCGGLVITWLGAKATAIAVPITVLLLLIVLPFGGRIHHDEEQERIRKANNALSGEP
ncbi:hypothetical protein BJF79_29520 [Actinomadura sp. CNU-125]|nr:hypothetical protein BJF79_29520 [Actinomadura sp. CNU-125]